MKKAPFDEVLVCDWSAAATARTGRDSIWIAHHGVGGKAHQVVVHNPATRAHARRLVVAAIETALEGGRSLFCGFDFSFGYPAGFSARISDLAMGAKKPFEVPFDVLTAMITDDEMNANNRFEVANALNDHLEMNLFWGRPRGPRHEGLTMLSPTTAGRPTPDVRGIGELRLCEQSLGRRIATNWQLLGVGSVGSQVLCGMPVIEGLRKHFGSSLSLWPYECVEVRGEQPQRSAHGPVVIAEVWPSLFDPNLDVAMVRDEAQVRHVAALLAGLDATRWEELLVPRAFASMGAAALQMVLEDEGWMFGLVDIAAKR